MNKEPSCGAPDVTRDHASRREPRWFGDAPVDLAKRGPALTLVQTRLAEAGAREPRAEIPPEIQRLPLRHPVGLGAVHWPSFILSFVLHAAVFVLSFVGFNLDFFLKPQEPQVVEVTFGVEVPSQIKAAPPKKDDPMSDAEPQPEQGTKVPEQLPQLPQRFDIETKPPETQSADMPTPDLPSEQPAPATPPPATPKPAEATPTPNPKAIVAEERDKDARKIDINEVIERMKREDRKVAEKEKPGPNKIPDSPFSKPSDLPPNPLADRPVPNMPDSLAPSGSLAGRRLAGSALEAYRTSALVHMKRNWNIPGVYNFPANLEAVAVVVVDLFGKIRSLEIDRSSGNAAFDDLVFSQIRGAEPFPDFPDDSVRTQKLYMKFNPQTID